MDSLVLEEKNLLNSEVVLVEMEALEVIKVLRSERNLNTLIDFRYAQHFKAKSGEKGGSSNMTGHGGKDLTLRVPLGTQVYAEDKKTLIDDCCERR